MLRKPNYIKEMINIVNSCAITKPKISKIIKDNKLEACPIYDEHYKTLLLVVKKDKKNIAVLRLFPQINNILNDIESLVFISTNYEYLANVIYGLLLVFDETRKLQTDFKHEHLVYHLNEMYEEFDKLSNHQIAALCSLSNFVYTAMYGMSTFEERVNAIFDCNQLFNINQLLFSFKINRSQPTILNNIKKFIQSYLEPVSNLLESKKRLMKEEA